MLKTAVVGVGALGWHHARLYQECANASLSGVFDTCPQRCADIASKLGVRAYTNLAELAADAQAVSVAVPAHHHFATARALLQAGCHVLVEKPLTTQLEDAQELVVLARQNNRLLQVGHIERFNPVVQALQPHLEQPRFIEAHRLAGFPPPRPDLPPRGTEVGVVLDLMIHDIDLILSLVHSPLIHVDAVGVCILSSHEDLANARLRFANGCVANLTASRVSTKTMRTLRVFQDQAYLRLDCQSRQAEVFRKEGNRINHQAVEVGEHNALAEQLGSFVSSALRAEQGLGLHAPVDGREGLRALEVAHRILASIQAQAALNPPPRPPVELALAPGAPARTSSEIV
nr:Gfo/Idh/MocA family oxidoreductase [Oceanococcus sp. HetDA_MAG_MS8]